jgi:hypothetical protein
MVIKVSMQQLADKFGFGFRRVRVAVVSDAAVHPSHQIPLCSLSRVHLRVDAGHAERQGARFKMQLAPSLEHRVSTGGGGCRGAKSKSSGVGVNSVLT